VSRPFISFLTDFGPDGPAPICRGVMLGIAPDANIVDVGHSITKYAIAEGAYLLASAVAYLPVGVHVAVVDPGVGTERLPVATERLPRQVPARAMLWIDAAGARVTPDESAASRRRHGRSPS
jgi:S-adenosylmethionine hydrolase